MNAWEQANRDWKHPVVGVIAVALCGGITAAAVMGTLLLVLEVPEIVGVPIAALSAGLAIFASAYVLKRAGL